MEDILVSDDELIYLIRQNNEEAKRLLFLRYETDKSAIDSVYCETILDSVNAFEYEKGYFFYFFKEVFEKNLIAYYRKYKYKTRNEILLRDYDEENISFELCDDYNYQSDVLDFNLIINYIKEEDPLSYQVLILWLKGYRYTEISKCLKIPEKKVYYLLNKMAKSKLKR